jgi:hypothetical protein
MPSRAILMFMLTIYPCLQSVTPAVMRRLMRELVELKKSPPEGVRVVTSEDNMLDVTGIIEGPGTYILYCLLVSGG